MIGKTVLIVGRLICLVGRYSLVNARTRAHGSREVDLVIKRKRGPVSISLPASPSAPPLHPLPFTALLRA